MDAWGESKKALRELGGLKQKLKHKKRVLKKSGYKRKKKTLTKASLALKKALSFNS